MIIDTIEKVAECIHTLCICHQYMISRYSFMSQIYRMTSMLILDFSGLEFDRVEGFCDNLDFETIHYIFSLHRLERVCNQFS